MSDELDIAVRAYAVPFVEPKDRKRKPTRRGQNAKRFPRHALIFDTETTTDHTQTLIFGAWRYCRVTRDREHTVLRCVEEGLFYADDLPQRDPHALAVLQQYAASRRADVVHGVLDAHRHLSCEPCEQWIRRVLWRVAYRLRGAVVCFNFPFDISRIAWAVGPAGSNRHQRDDDALDGGFSFSIWSHEVDGQRTESQHRPRIAVKSIDAKRALKAFRSPAQTDAIDRQPDTPIDGKDWRFRGHFVDLRTLVFALTDRGHSLESACEAFDVSYVKRDVTHGDVTADYVTYCREDVAATQGLCEATVDEFLRHPIDLQATRAYSPATIGKGYLQEMGITPIARRQPLDPTVLGYAMSAYYGGWTECRIRRTPVPVVYCDFKSMYPTVCALMELWTLITARRVQTVEATEEVRTLLERVMADDCFDATIWPEFVGVALVEPDGDVLPVRARYAAGPSWQIGVNRLTSPEPLWFTVPDLIASKLRTGKAPRIRRAIRFTPEGKLPNLKTVDLLGNTPVDPERRDLFRTVIEQRTLAKRASDGNRSKGLKTLANATSYGIYAQMTRRELGSRQQPVSVHGYRDQPFVRSLSTPEEPGDYAFPPIAAAITGAARLLLAMVEHEVTTAGGTYAFCDTDSMAIVSTERGGLITCAGGPTRLPGASAIQALPWAQVDEIRERFTALNPYDAAIVPGSILELEDENYDDSPAPQRRQLQCYAISAKRYTFYTDHSDGPRLVKASRHGLGHLLNPSDPEREEDDWIDQTWEWLLRRDLGLPADEPHWLDQVAVGRLTISSPHLHRLLRSVNDDSEYGDQIKPFNFLGIAFVPPAERPADEQQMVLIAPYTTDPNQWRDAPWLNRYTGRTYRITIEPSCGRDRAGTVTAKTYRAALTEYETHPEAKSADPNGGPCTRRTRGRLTRRSVVVRTITHIGKEGNALEQAQAGFHQRQDDFLTTYDDTEQLVFQQVTLPILRALGVREVARRTGHSVGAVHAVLTGKAQPRASARRRYMASAKPPQSVS